MIASPSEFRLPPTLDGTQSKNDFYEPPRSARETEWVRATSLNVLRSCPEQFHAKFLLSLPQPRPRAGTMDYAWVGTIAHDVIEHYLTHDWGLDHPFAVQIQVALEKNGMPRKEVIKLGGYLKRLENLRTRVEVIEHQFDLVLIPGYPRIRGHIDLIAEWPEGKVLIVDHKTSRSPKPQDKWIDDLQTMAYSWAVRQLVPGWDIGFRIGYVNLGYDIEWDSHPSFDLTLEKWFGRAWQKVLEYERSAFHRFPATPCDTCKYCPRSGSCPAEKKAKGADKHLLAKTREMLGLNDKKRGRS